MNKLTDNEIIKALECCDSGSAHECDFCEFQGNECRAGIISKARDLVNRQKAEIEKAWDLFKKKSDENIEIQMLCDKQKSENERLKTAYETLKQEYDSMFSANRNLMAEVERLKKAGGDTVSCFTRMETLYKIKCKELEVAKSEAIKEFAERLNFIMYPNVKLEYADIEDLVKELTEKNDKG